MNYNERINCIQHRLKRMRIDKGITQQELAKKIEVDVKSISRYETGESEPNREILIRYAKYFNCSVDYILDNEIKRNLPLVVVTFNVCESDKIALPSAALSKVASSKLGKTLLLECDERLIERPSYYCGISEKSKNEVMDIYDNKFKLYRNDDLDVILYKDLMELYDSIYYKKGDCNMTNLLIDLSIKYNYESIFANCGLGYSVMSKQLINKADKLIIPVVDSYTAKSAGKTLHLLRDSKNDDKKIYILEATFSNEKNYIYDRQFKLLEKEVTDYNNKNIKILKNDIFEMEYGRYYSLDGHIFDSEKFEWLREEYTQVFKEIII